MTKSFAASVERVGEGDLPLFRDAILVYCQALRERRPFHCQASPEAAELLSWLGVAFESGSAPQQGEESFLPQAPKFPATPLSDYRSRGFLGTTLFAALVRSSYGPEEPGYFPTQSELGFYFEEGLVRAEIRWDEDYLTECQEFFFEELTPAEMLDQAMALLDPELESLKERYRAELLGVIFLIGEQETFLTPMSEFLNRLLSPEVCRSEFQALLRGLDDWQPDSLLAAWGSLDGSTKAELEQAFFGPYAQQAEEILVASGENFLKWRAGL